MGTFGQGSLNALLAQQDLMINGEHPTAKSGEQTSKKAQPFCSKLVELPYIHMLCVISQIFKFEALPRSLDSSSLSWHLERDQRGPGVLLQEHLNQRCHERGLISKALNCTWIRKDVVMVELLSSGG